MKIGLLCYHKNAQKLYPQRWMDQYKESVLNQTYKNFQIIETNYGGTNFRVFENSEFDNVPADNFVQCLNRLLDKCFFEDGYDFVFNSNLDDYQSLDRIEKQLPYLESGYDIVSSNFCLLKDDVIVRWHKFHELDIAQQLANNHNPICHPVVGYSRRFWETHRYIPEQQPLEDMMLWQRAIKNCSFIILEENLLYHRLHQESVCQSQNR